MKCPYCTNNENKVIDSRETLEGKAVRRRRECLRCGKRFTTYEQVEEMHLMVKKKDGRREPFNRNKIAAGLVKACEKRSIGVKEIEDVVDSIEAEIQKKFEHEVDSSYIGELVIKKLFRLDDVAYVRFASVYRQFKDINQFMSELKDVLIRKTK